MRRRHRTPWIALLLALAAARAAGEAAPSADGAGPFVILRVEFEVTGRTLPAVLRAKIDPYGRLLGTVVADRAGLEALLRDLRQILLNERAVASASVECESAGEAAGGTGVALRFRVTDTENVVLLPYPRYSSNTGLDLGLRLRDYDFLGSLETLSVNLDWFLDTAGNASFGGHGDFLVPFRLWGLSGSAGLVEDARVGLSTAPASATSLRLSLVVPGPGFPVTLTATQGVSLNANGLDPALQADPDPWFLSESLGASAAIPLGPLQYAPALSVSLNWVPGGSLYQEGREGISGSFTNALSWGRVDWEDDLRRGAAASLTGAVSCAFSDMQALCDVTFTAAAHAVPLPRLGLSGRLVLLDRIPGTPEAAPLSGLGSYMRGILDARLSALQAAFLNLDAALKLFEFPAHALLGAAWLDFGLQAKPFLDVGLFAPSGSRTDLLAWAGGLELLVFPAAFRSFVGRAGVGWDLPGAWTAGSPFAVGADGSPVFEVFVGLGLLY